MLDVIRFLHSWTRWLVLLIALTDLAYFAVAYFRQRPYTALARRLASLFSIAISIQWVLGLILLIVLGSQTGFGVRHYWEHLVVMTLAVVASNVPAMLRRRTLPDQRRYLAAFISIVVVFALVFVGITLLPDAIRWRFFTP